MGTMKFLYPYLLFITIIVLTGCEKEESERKDTAENRIRKDNVSEATKEMTEKPKETMTMELVEGSSEIGRAETATERPPLPGKEFLLVQQYDEPTAAEDLIIGKLYNVFTGEEEEDKLYNSIDVFLSSLTSAEVAENVLYKESTEDIKRQLWYHFDRGNIPDAFRIGEIFVESSEGRADIRLIGTVGRAAGEIYCRKLDDEWYISDFQIDLADLLRTYEKDGPYEPNVYRWINQY